METALDAVGLAALVVGAIVVIVFFVGPRE